jgi:transaldolase/glucose-6-phosphate isomerase
VSVLETLRQQNFLERLYDRDPSLWSDDSREQQLISKRLGWLEVHRSMLLNLRQLAEVAAWVRENEIRHVVLLGMGGSSLAPEVLARTFGAARGYPELIVLDTTDPATILRVENRISILSTLFIVSSKSGTTIESESLHRYFAERTMDASGDTGALQNFIAVTDPGTPLHEFAEVEGFHRVFLNPPDIGGRFSALSFFGLVPAAAIGIDIQDLLEEAGLVDREEAFELGARLGELAGQGRDKITFLASSGVEAFGAWAEQLLAESTGKRGRGLIPIDLEPIGPPDVYGADRVFVHLDDGAGELTSTVQALAEAGHPVLTSRIPDVYALGREFLRWEIATATAGGALRINPFDEPNVQESKDNTRAILEDYARESALPASVPVAEETGASLFAAGNLAATLRPDGASSIADMLASHFRAAKAGSYIALMAYIPRTEQHDRLLARLRTAIRDATRCATTAGYGPRYLHSTGQLHKGGPDNGVFLQVTGEDETDLDIPLAPYTFGTLKQAQAIGDLQALQSRNRPVIRLHLHEDVTANFRRIVDAVEATITNRAAVD